MSSPQKVVMVSSTVYGIEELLDRIYTLLTAFGYEVWMSHKGTLPVFSNCSNFENCVRAVEKCDLFLCLITPRYGSGIGKGNISITHHELRKAIELNKPRWLLAHDHVVFARSLIKHLGYVDSEARSGLTLTKNPILDDLRVIDMYEEAVRNELPLEIRQGNWVQNFRSPEDASMFITAQFSRYQEVEAFIKENFADQSEITDMGQQKESSS